MHSGTRDRERKSEDMRPASPFPVAAETLSAAYSGHPCRASLPDSPVYSPSVIREMLIARETERDKLDDIMPVEIPIFRRAKGYYSELSSVVVD